MINTFCFLNLEMKGFENDFTALLKTLKAFLIGSLL